MIVHVDWRTWLVSPMLAHHPSADPEPWRALLQEQGFALEEEGTPFTTGGDFVMRQPFADHGS